MPDRPDPTLLRRCWRHAGVVIWLCSQPLPAQTLWGYVDGAGVAHFADHPADSRFSRVLPEANADQPGRVPGKTMGSQGLLIWLEFAPEVKSLQPLLREAERRTGVDAELLKAIITVESGYRPHLVSPRGAIGLMQITPEAADHYASRSDKASAPAETRLLDPRHNVLTGAQMLADLSRRLGGVDLALAAWNAGEGAVRRHGGKMPPYPETRAHVHQVLELYWALLQQRHQGQVRQLKMHPPDSSAAAPR